MTAITEIKDTLIVASDPIIPRGILAGQEAQRRRYQSRWTRFSQPDPFDGSYDISDPQSFNRYSYGENDPVTSIDPSGLSDIDNWTPGPGDTIDGGTAWAPRPVNWFFFGLNGFGGRGIRHAISEYELRGGWFLPRDTEQQNSGQKPPCPPVPEAPPGADIDANIREMQQSLRDAKNPPIVADIGGGAFRGGQSLSHVSGFAARVAPGGSWDYKTQNTREDQYTPFGNFNFGAAGAAAGFSEGQLLRAAGWVQYWSYKLGVTSDPGDGGRVNVINALTGSGGQAPFHDQRVDQENIIAGINYYNRKFMLGDCQ